MTLATTERLHDQAVGLDTCPPAEAAALLASVQVAAAEAVKQASDSIAQASSSMADVIRNGRSLFYAAAGSSGLMAAADAMELGGTFGIPSSQIRIVMAGGLPTSADMPGETEDDTAELAKSLEGIGPGDAMIAVTASGSTPFTLAAVKIARDEGATVIGLANNAGAPLFDNCQHAILLQTPPEILSGSTRMGAGTAQKIALNSLSTLMAMNLGHVHDGMMVNVRADNQKLRDRARRMICSIAEVPEDVAGDAIDKTGGAVKPAILIAIGASFEEASKELEKSNGRLRPALERIRAGARVS